QHVQPQQQQAQTAPPTQGVTASPTVTASIDPAMLQSQYAATVQSLYAASPMNAPAGTGGGGVAVQEMSTPPNWYDRLWQLVTDQPAFGSVDAAISSQLGALRQDLMSRAQQ